MRCSTMSKRRHRSAPGWQAETGMNAAADRMSQDGVMVRIRRAALLVPLLSSGAFLALMYTAVSPVLAGMVMQFGVGSDAMLAAQLFMTMPSIGMMAGGLASGWLVARTGGR